MRTLLSNQAYIGNLVQYKSTTISYKNHKWQRRPEEEWIVVENAHEAIISKELWDKVKEVERAVGHGKHTQRGYMHPLSGLMFCANGGKVFYGYRLEGRKIVVDEICSEVVKRIFDEFSKGYCVREIIAKLTAEGISEGLNEVFQSTKKSAQTEHCEIFGLD